MNTIIKQINDRLVVPMELLKTLNLNKGDLVKFNIDDNNPNLITIKAYTEQELIEESNIDNIKSELKQESQKSINEYNVIVRPRKIITIPNDIFKKYELSYQPYKTTSSINNNGKLIITLIKDNDGDFKYRKGNELSLSYFEEKYNIDIPIGIQIKLKAFDESQQISLVFDIGSTTLKVNEELNQPINSQEKEQLIQKEEHEESKNTEIQDTQETQSNISFNDERTITINKRHIITIPNDIFTKLNLSNKSYLPVFSEDNDNIYISLVTSDTYSENDLEKLKHYRVSNSLTITEAIRDYIETPEIGTTFTLMYEQYNENLSSILFIFDKSKVNKKQETNQQSNIKLKESLDTTVEQTNKNIEIEPYYDEQNETDIKRKQLYHEINKRIKRRRFNKVHK